MAPTDPRFDALRSLWKGLASLKLTIFLLSLLMILVAFCTFAQVPLGTFGAVKVYIRSFFVYGTLPGTGWKFPVFPGGAMVGMLLFFNLLAAQFTRLEFSWRKLGLWLSHGGILLLIVGEFVTGSLQVESQMAVEEGQTRNYSENAREAELVVVDASAPDHDLVVSVPESVLRRGGRVSLPPLPFTLSVKTYYANSALNMGGDGGSPANQGVGLRAQVQALPPVTADDQVNTPSAYVEILAGERSLGTWLASMALGAPQGFSHEGRAYRLALRPRRYYLPFSLTLKDFRHDKYAGTDIPKNFSSLVRLRDPERGEDRDVLIWMNHPLRHRGLSFYQASFGKNDTLSVFQVVENPGRLIPYLSCTLVFLGLLYHFGLQLAAYRRRNA